MVKFAVVKCYKNCVKKSNNNGCTLYYIKFLLLPSFSFLLEEEESSDSLGNGNRSTTLVNVQQNETSVGITLYKFHSNAVIYIFVSSNTSNILIS